MNPPDFFEWSKEEKEQYALEKMRKMREINDKLNRKYVAAKLDKHAAECANSSVTNLTKKPDVSTERSSCRSEKVEKDGERFTREWDRGKDNDDWRDHSPKAFKNYRTSDYDRRNFRNESRTSYDDRRYRDDYAPDKKKKYYNKNNRSRIHTGAYGGSSKETWYPSSESSRKFQDSQDKNKRYFSSDTKKHYKHQSNSSSTDSECKTKWNKTKSSNAEASALWHSERLNEDKNKRERTQKWIESMQECNIETEKNSADEEEKSNESPKRKLDKFETDSDKYLNDSDVPHVASSSRIELKQSCNLKSRKLDYVDNKSTTKSDNMMKEEKTEILKKSYTKFDRINRSDHSSDDSDSNCTNKHDCIEKDNNNLEKIPSKNNMKLENFIENLHSEENREPSNSGSQFVKRSTDNEKYSPVRKVYSHNDGYIISREFTYSDRRCNEKDRSKGSKAKRSPETNLEYNLPQSCKNEHFSKQRKFDKGQSNESGNNQRWNNQRCKWNRQNFVSSANKNRSMKAEKCFDKKKSDFNVVQSSSQDEDGWGNIPQSQVEDDDDDDGIWASTDQSDIKWKLNEEEKKSPKFISGGHNKKREKAFKEKPPTASDDGGWSTVEEGEIRSDTESDDDLEESKEHVK